MPYPYGMLGGSQPPALSINNVIHPFPPARHGSSWFVVLQDYGTRHIEIWRSTDEGVTWAEADSANHKLYTSTANRRTFHVSQSGSVLYVTFTPDGGTTTAIAPFDMALATWGTVITGGPTPDIQTASDRVTSNAQAMSAPLGSGQFITFYTKNFTDSFSATRTEIRYQIYNSGWGSDTAFLTPEVQETSSFSFALHSVLVGASSRVHVIFETQSNRYGRRVYRAGSSYGYRRETVDWLRDLSGAGSAAILATLQGVQFVVAPLVLGGGGSLHVPCVLMYEDADEVSVSRLDAVLVPTQLSTNWQTATAAYDSTNGRLHLLWTNYDGSNYEVKQVCTAGLNWSAITTIFSAGANLVESIIAAISSGQLGFVIENSSGGTYFQPHWWQGAASCSVAADSGSGSLYIIT